MKNKLIIMCFAFCASFSLMSFSDGELKNEKVINSATFGSIQDNLVNVSNDISSPEAYAWKAKAAKRLIQAVVAILLDGVQVAPDLENSINFDDKVEVAMNNLD